MENSQQQPQFVYPAPQKSNFMNSTTARVIMIGLLTLALLLPLEYVKSLIWERKQLQGNVTNELAQQWGGKVYFYGPVLKVPYEVVTSTEITDKTTKTVSIQRNTAIEYAYFFPDELKADTKVTTEKKSRGNYESTVFNSTMNVSGLYSTPEFSKQNISPESILWDKASIVIRTGNLKSIKGAANIVINGTSYAFEPTAVNPESDEVLETNTIKFPVDSAKIKFNLAISYDGTESIDIVPIGKLTEVSMTSNWPHPDFKGNFLPSSKKITDTGFTANWKVTHLNRPFVQQYFQSLPNLKQYAFSTHFIIPNDQYQQNERAAKYGFLVIGLTFLVFFLIQTMSRISIHIFQYSMIGLALIMFYTLLISITEHSSFSFAYIISGTAVVALIGLYSVSILKIWKFPIFIVSALTGLYAFIYVIIQLENYALLAGSIGLFAILAAIMYFSRKIDWNQNMAS